MKNVPNLVVAPSADYAEFMKWLEEGKHLEPFPGEIPKVNITSAEIKRISDKYPIKLL